MTALSIPELQQLIQDTLHGPYARSPRNEWEHLRHDVIDTLNAQIPSPNEKLHQVSPQNGSNTAQVVHYTSLSTLVDILKAAQPHDNPGISGSATPANSDDGPNAQSNGNVGYLRMYSSARSNDPDEGRYLFGHCASKVPTTGESLTAYLLGEPATESLTARPKPPYAYLTSFIVPKSKPEHDANNLIFWRAYGRDGHGCSLTVTIAPEELRKVLYGHEKARNACKEITAALDNIREIIQEIQAIGSQAGNSAIREWISTTLSPRIQAIAYLYKSSPYAYENEARIVCIPGGPQAKNPRIELMGHPKSGTTTRYIEIPQLSTNPSTGIFRSGSVVTLGPQVPNPIHAEHDIRTLLRRAGIHGTVVQRSEIAYRGNSH